jgi:ketosteroid isomerase-like protein
MEGCGVDGTTDESKILAYIRSIFEAYLRQDRETIRDTHSDDWTGFAVSSTAIERGLDAYMQRAEDSLRRFRGVSYELRDTEVQILGDVALVYYVARYDYRDGSGRTGSLPLRSLDVYRRDARGWTQAGSHITVFPPPPAVLPRELATEERSDLLAAREAVWRAWFAGDREALARELPAELIALDPYPGEWADRSETVRRSRQFAESGARLQRLEFPRTEIQCYGALAVLYTDYVAEIVNAEGVAQTMAGRGTEIFVEREGRWVNVGWHLDSITSTRSSRHS